MSEFRSELKFWQAQFGLNDLKETNQPFSYVILHMWSVCFNSIVMSLVFRSHFQLMRSVAVFLGCSAKDHDVIKLTCKILSSCSETIWTCCNYSCNCVFWTQKVLVLSPVFLLERLMIGCTITEICAWNVIDSVAFTIMFAVTHFDR